MFQLKLIKSWQPETNRSYVPSGNNLKQSHRSNDQENNACDGMAQSGSDNALAALKWLSEKNPANLLRRLDQRNLTQGWYQCCSYGIFRCDKFP